MVNPKWSMQFVVEYTVCAAAMLNFQVGPTETLEAGKQRDRRNYVWGLLYVL